MKEKILIVDDSEINSEFLSDILISEYEILRASNGEEAINIISQNIDTLSLVLLDLIMPKMDGFEVLKYMNKYNWIEVLPVIIISSETSGNYISKGYELGATDFINRPFDVQIVKKRVKNTIALYTKQKRLADLVKDQMYQKEKRSSLMIAILSHIVEFRNGESGLHILHINVITEKLLNQLVAKYNVNLTKDEISVITMASSLHDIGKIYTPDEILNKPGRLTKEEFEIIKLHTINGAKVIKDLNWANEPLLDRVYEICRWHHERYDGNGYPDHLKGDEIPLSAQVVSVADVYDALTSERCYKKAIPHDKTMEMILNGECGQFNPMLLECLKDISEDLRKELYDLSPRVTSSNEIKKMVKEYNRFDELSLSAQVINNLELEKNKLDFFTEKLDKVSFIYNTEPEILLFPNSQIHNLHLDESYFNPRANDSLLTDNNREVLNKVIDIASNTSVEHPNFSYNCQLDIDSKNRRCHLECRALWLVLEYPVFKGFVGMITKMEENEPIKPEFVLADPNEQVMSLTYNEAYDMVKQLKLNFDKVTLITDNLEYEIQFNDDGTYDRFNHVCYFTKNKKTDRCISQKAIKIKGKVTKFEYLKNNIYFLMARYILIDNEPYVLEILSKNQNNIILNEFNHQRFIDSMDSLQKEIYIDEVTGSFNRKYLTDQISSLGAIEALAMIDLDNFKKINDTYGHITGDLVLKEAYNCMKKSLKDNGIIVRYGGDEFIILINSISKKDLVDVLERIRSNIEHIKIQNYENMHISCSIGATYGNDQVDKLLADADKILYNAKKKRNMVSFKE